MTEAAAPLPDSLTRIQLPALIAGIVGLVVCALGLVFARDRFFVSWLWAYLFWIGIPLGCMALLMLQHLTGGAWGVLLRRPMEISIRMLPLMLVLFLPLLPGLHRLYHWTHPSPIETGHSALRDFWLRGWFFLIRAAIYFAIWLGFAFLLTRWSMQQQHGGDVRSPQRLRRLSAPGLVIYVLTVTFAAVDWVMSIDPSWTSSIWGFVFVAGQALSGMAFLIALVSILAARRPAPAIPAVISQDLGNLLLAFVMIWAYISFSQLLIIWSGNIAEETPFYLYRSSGGWKLVAALLIIAHFAIPFLLLLSREIKRRIELLAAVAGFILLMRVVDLFWNVTPMLDQGQRTSPIPGFHIHWLDFAAPIGIGGIWIAFFIQQLKRRPALLLDDAVLAVKEHA